MLKSLIETNDFYSKECNPHSLDTTATTLWRFHRFIHPIISSTVLLFSISSWDFCQKICWLITWVLLFSEMLSKSLALYFIDSRFCVFGLRSLMISRIYSSSFIF
jgi:hypothetical protein